MKNVIKIYFLFIILFIFHINVFAECSYQERTLLLKEAKNVQFNYEIEEKEVTESGVNTYGEDVTLTKKDYSIKFYVSNLSENIFIKYYNSLNALENYINLSDTDNGLYTFNDSNYSDFYNYYFEIYSSNENCVGKKIYTKNIVKPVLNGYSNYKICSIDGMEDFKYCKRFITEKISISESEFIDLANKHLELKETKESEKEEFNIINFMKNYGIYIGAGVGLIAIIIVLLIIRKRKNAL